MNKTGNKSFEWLIHILVWVVLLSLPAAFAFSSGRMLKDVFLHFWTQVIFLAVVFYLNYFVLLPLWSKPGKRIVYIVINFLLILGLSYLRNHLIFFFGDMPNRGGNKPPPPLAFRFYIDFLVYLIPVAFAFAIQSGKKIMHIESLKKEADNIKLESELKHLKFQLQPHFFFNSLNNIYASIDSDPVQAKTAIHSLSKLMRYFLQQSEQDKVSLREELDFLNRYIELMKMRMTDKTSVNVSFPNDIPGISIPPLILISLVENAFKHGVSATEKSAINIELKTSESEIHFTTTNTNFPKQADDRSGSGIGLSNLEKRLQLLYPNTHSFTTQLNDNIFNVNLVIPIS